LLILTSRLQSAGIKVHKAVDDADTLIIKIALVISESKKVVVVANDTDILVLLLHHFKSGLFYIHMLCEVVCREADNRQLIPIKEVCNKLGCVLCDALPMLHASTGCDTTSAIFGHGKRSTFKKLAALSDLPHFSAILGCEASLHQQVGEVGKELIAEIC